MEKTPTEETSRLVFVEDKTILTWLDGSDWARVTRTRNSSQWSSLQHSQWRATAFHFRRSLSTLQTTEYLMCPHQVTSSSMNRWTLPTNDLLYNGRPNQVSLGLMRENWFLWHVGFHTGDKCMCVCVWYIHGSVFSSSLPWSLWSCEKLVQEMRQKSALTASNWSNWSEIYEKLVCEAVSHRGQWVHRLDDQMGKKSRPSPANYQKCQTDILTLSKDTTSHRKNLCVCMQTAPLSLKEFSPAGHNVSKNNGMPQQERIWQPVKEAPARGSIAVMSIFTRRSSVNTKRTEKSGRYRHTLGLDSTWLRSPPTVKKKKARRFVSHPRSTDTP